MRDRARENLDVPTTADWQPVRQVVEDGAPSACSRATTNARWGCGEGRPELSPRDACSALRLPPTCSSGGSPSSAASAYRHTSCAAPSSTSRAVRPPPQAVPEPRRSFTAPAFAPRASVWARSQAASVPASRATAPENKRAAAARVARRSFVAAASWAASSRSRLMVWSSSTRAVGWSVGRLAIISSSQQVAAS